MTSNKKPLPDEHHGLARLSSSGREEEAALTGKEESVLTGNTGVDQVGSVMSCPTYSPFSTMKLARSSYFFGL